MSLTHELGLRKRIELLPHEALLNIYYTASCLKKRADEFFRNFGLTDVQFNVMMLLHYQSGEEGGLSQAQLSDMMLVNRANITSLIDRMEKAELVVRTAAPGDRRYNIVKLLYARQVQEVMAVFKLGEQKRLVAMLEKVRSKLSKQ
jgi:DNA-binding MarR family transcriptional regulator